MRHRLLCEIVVLDFHHAKSHVIVSDEGLPRRIPSLDDLESEHPLEKGNTRIKIHDVQSNMVKSILNHHLPLLSERWNSPRDGSIGAELNCYKELVQVLIWPLPNS